MRGHWLERLVASSWKVMSENAGERAYGSRAKDQQTIYMPHHYSEKGVQVVGKTLGRLHMAIRLYFFRLGICLFSKTGF